MPVSMVKAAWRAISLPWSQVMVRNSSPGSVAMAWRIACIDRARVAAVGQVQQHHVAGGALDEGADRGPAVLADDEVAFPVAGHGPVVGLGGPFADHDHVGDAGPVFSSRPRGAGAWPGRCAGSGPAPGAARRGPARTGTGRSSRGSPTSSDRRGTRSASGRRSPAATTTPRARRSPGPPAGDRPAWAASADGPAPGPADGPATPDSRPGHRWRRPLGSPSRSPDPAATRWR